MGLRGFLRGIGRCCALGVILTCLIACLISWPVPSAAWAPAPTCVRLFEGSGPTFRFELPGIQRDPTAAKLKTLKIAHYSLYQFDFFPNANARPDLQNRNVAVQAILFEKPDILTLSEVMNQATLLELARRLGGIYEPFMVEGNDSSSVAVLIRKSLPVIVEIESHRALKHKYLGEWVPLYNRDLLIVHLTLPGATRPLLTLGTSHFKARKNNFKSDPGFAIKRAAQEQSAVAILDVTGSIKSSRARIFVGDVNTDVRRQDEMRFFKGAGYQDALNILGIPMGRRASHSYFSRDGTPEFWQTDVAFVSREIALRTALVGGYIAPDRSLTGQALERPRNIYEMRERGSDHKMIVIEIDVTKLR